VELNDEQIENIVRRSYQYVAMYNVNNKFALKQGGWNTVDADTKLKDHTMREIARPNNDTLYISCLLDLRRDPVILEMPAFDSDYVSLMITGYDHYVNIPMATRLGDFRKIGRCASGSKILLNYFVKVGMSPNIMVNWKASGGNAYTVPIGFGVGKLFKFGKLPVKLGLEAQYSVVRPDDLGTQWNIRIQ
jgi:hypothetical protein